MFNRLGREGEGNRPISSARRDYRAFNTCDTAGIVYPAWVWFLIRCADYTRPHDHDRQTFSFGHDDLLRETLAERVAVGMLADQPLLYYLYYLVVQILAHVYHRVRLHPCAVTSATAHN